jgi:His/Glu/Gln/Arg/opine family amino acid ABC transporter permease subunit
MILSNSWHLLLHSFPLFLSGTITTILVALASFCIGLFGGTIFGILSCDHYKSWFSLPINLYVLIIRGTPVVLQLLLVYFALPSILGINFSPLTAGIITLGFNSIAYIAEIIRGGMNAIHRGQWEASYVLGLSNYATIKTIILPQVFATVLSPLTNETIALIKETSVVSIIGLLELTRIGMNISAKTLDPMTTYGTLAFIYLTITTSISLGSTWLERKLNHD